MRLSSSARRVVASRWSHRARGPGSGHDPDDIARRVRAGVGPTTNPRLPHQPIRPGPRLTPHRRSESLGGSSPSSRSCARRRSRCRVPAMGCSESGRISDADRRLVDEREGRATRRGLDATDTRLDFNELARLERSGDPAATAHDDLEPSTTRRHRRSRLPHAQGRRHTTGGHRRTCRHQAGKASSLLDPRRRPAAHCDFIVVGVRSSRARRCADGEGHGPSASGASAPAPSREQATPPRRGSRPAGVGQAPRCISLTTRGRHLSPTTPRRSRTAAGRCTRPVMPTCCPRASEPFASASCRRPEVSRHGLLLRLREPRGRRPPGALTELDTVALAAR